MSAPRALTAAAPRLAAVLLCLLAALRPSVLLQEKKKRPATLVFLLDDSSSMKINDEVRALFAEQAFLQRAIVPNMFESMVTSPEQFAEFIKRDSAKWEKVLREANIRAE